MEAVIAGWVAGYAMGIAYTVALAGLAWRARDSESLQRLVAREVNSALLTVPIFMGATMVWTMVGIIAGSAYGLSELDEGGWPGTAFYTVIVGFAALPLPPLLLLWPKHWVLWLALGALFIAMFGGLMPALASR